MKMSFKDDETLPLTGFSEEFLVDVTVDEDFIPTSQPHSIVSKVTKIVESPLKPEEVNTQSLSGFVDDTLPPEALLQETQDKSIDFIPDTETKKIKIDYSNHVGCKKKLQVFGTEDIFASPWEKDRISENHLLELQTNSILYDSPFKMDSPSSKPENSVTEIVVNDSAETVQLEDTPVKCEKPEGVEKSDNSSFTLERSKETQVLDNSVLLLDTPGPSGETKESQKLYLNETVDDQVQGEVTSDSKVPKAPDEIIETEKETGLIAIKNEPPLKSASQDADNHSAIIRKVDFKLTVSCLLTINPKTKEILKKTVLNVTEQPKPKPQLLYNEPPSDSTSDKSKRCSTSSSGSIYSDKNGLPFALPKRVSDQTFTSDSSEENYNRTFLHERINLERIPWSNEYLFAVKMDDIIKNKIDNPDWINKPNMPSPKKPKSMLRSDLNNLAHISENSSSDGTLTRGNDGSSAEKTSDENTEATQIDERESMSEVGKDSFSIPAEEEKTERKEKDSNDNVKEVEATKELETESVIEGAQDVRLCEGLKVFARWTDKQYYSGVLSGQGKNDKWDVLFDDGTLKAIKQDFIMPTAWLKIGTLVFALVDDNYESGQITEIKRGEKPTYVVHLDNGKGEVSVQLSDLCLSDDMSSIVRENYRPIGIDSPRVKADIDCDNVVSGKRLREYRTPLRPTVSRVESSSSKKPKGRDSERIKETPKKKMERKVGLKSESEHLVEDKDPSAESPPGNETDVTPLRSTSKEARGKAKPRSLTYEQEERQKKRKQNWLNADGTPIPGPSGVKFRKKKESTEEGLVTTSSSPQPAERSRRKRKAEAAKEEISNAETEVKPTRGKKKER